MGSLFGKPKKPKSRVTEHDKAILQLKQQRDKLKQYQKQIETSLENDRRLARKCLESGRRERAKLLLRKKKYQEKLLENTDIQLENLEKLASDIEFAQVELQVINGLKLGNLALKKVHEVLTIDEVERIMDETREGVEKQQEIDTIISGALTEEDENAVLAELDELTRLEELENRMVKDTDREDEDIESKLPEVPSDELPERRQIKKAEQNTPIALEA